MNYPKMIEAIDSAENEIKDAESEFTHGSEAEEIDEFYDLTEGRRLLASAIRYLTDALVAVDEDAEEDNEDPEDAKSDEDEDEDENENENENEDESENENEKKGGEE